MASPLRADQQSPLHMPGRVTWTNAQEREGETLIWEIGPLETLATPVEIVAESLGGPRLPEPVTAGGESSPALRFSRSR